MLKKAKVYLITTTFVMLALGGVVLAVDNYPYFDPKDTGYGITNDDKPWFDGKDYPYFRDMYDGKNLKPMEEGSYEKFPQDSVPVKVSLNRIQRIYDPFIPAIAGNGAGKVGHPREFYPRNPTEATSGSITRGRVLYNTYCAACHGTDGLAKTVVVMKGVPAPAINEMVKIPTWGPHLYNKIKYGSFFQEPRGYMPAFGAQTSVQDRWDMVNYMMSNEAFSKEVVQ
jgi:mono/diheme cytochrome c family protein